MPEVTIVLVVSSFVAGLLMFLAPCTLPLVPAYLAFISGVRQSEMDQPHLRRRIMVNGVAFVIGFTLIFTLFGMLAGFFGGFAGSLRDTLTQVGGVLIIIFGLMMLRVIPMGQFLKERHIVLPANIKPGHPLSAFLIGSIFALGWTPCIGPVLASILLLATTATTVYAGGFLLFVFSLGLAIPFLLTSLLYARASHLIERYARVSATISVIGGVFLIGIGLLLLFDNFGLTVQYGYELFGYLGFEGLFDYY